jgi:hypothetical protein
LRDGREVMCVLLLAGDAGTGCGTSHDGGSPTGCASAV